MDDQDYAEVELLRQSVEELRQTLADTRHDLEKLKDVVRDLIRGDAAPEVRWPPFVDNVSREEAVEAVRRAREERGEE